MEESTPKRGRPTLYTEEIAAEILERIAGGESLRSICTDGRFPHDRTVRGWAVDNIHGFSPRYARACEIRAEAWAEDILSIGDAPAADATDVKRATLRVDTRKWLLSKILPKKYGDKTQMEHTGSDGGPIEVVTTRRIVKSADDPS